jgi:hypothetical protein
LRLSAAEEGRQNVIYSQKRHFMPILSFVKMLSLLINKEAHLQVSPIFYHERFNFPILLRQTNKNKHFGIDDKWT